MPQYQFTGGGFAYLNGACKLGAMLTLDALCSEMEQSDRHLSPRAARDWWTKGLLPRPHRRGLGRGKGTETFWTDPRIYRQALVAHDLLTLYPRANITLLSLWLLGFPVSLNSVRAVYRNLMNHHFQSVHRRPGKEPQDIVSRFAEMLARREGRKAGAPIGAQHAIADLAVEFLGAFYAVGDEPESEGLADLWRKASPYLGGATSRPLGLAQFYPSDEDIGSWVQHVKEMASLPEQAKMIRSASDYELLRARRLLLFVFGHLGRFAHAAGRQETFEEFGQRLLIVLGRPAVPILVAVFRKGRLRSQITSLLLDIVRKMPPRAEWPLVIGPTAVS